MAHTTDEELEAKRAEVEKLREQLAAEEAKRTDREASLVNDITAAQLDTEAARLTAQLAIAKEAAKASNVTSSALPLEQAREQMKAAQAGATATEKAIAADSTSTSSRTTSAPMSSSTTNTTQEG